MLWKSQSSGRRLPQAGACGKSWRTERAWGNKHTNKPPNKACVCHQGERAHSALDPGRAVLPPGRSSGQCSQWPWDLASPKPPVTPGCSARWGLLLRPNTSWSLGGVEGAAFPLRHAWVDSAARLRDHGPAAWARVGSCFRFPFPLLCSFIISEAPGANRKLWGKR